MADPHHHAISSARKWGGKPEDYLHVHRWFDEPKGWLADPRQRAIRHHAEGILEAIKTFPPIKLKISGQDVVEPLLRKGPKLVPIRWVAEQHVLEDLGQIPTAADWLRRMPIEPWMVRSRKLSIELENDDDDRVSQAGTRGGQGREQGSQEER